MEAKEIGSFSKIAEELTRTWDEQLYKEFIAKLVKQAAKRLSESLDLSSRAFESAFEASGEKPTNQNGQAQAAMTRLERLQEMADSVVASPATFVLNKYENEEIATQFWSMLKKETQQVFREYVRAN